jgi:H+/Cl- antiporter ClcA
VPSRRRFLAPVPSSTAVSLGTDRRRLLVLAMLGVVLGLVGGVAAFLVVHLVGLISNLALLHRVGWDLPDLRHYHPSWVLVPIALGGGLVVALLARWAPVIKGHGIPESLEAIRLRESRIRPRAAFAKPVSAAVAMGTGGPFGAEGPIIVTGASLGSLLGQLLPVSASERRILLAVGAAAGMAGVFSTPVAAVVMAFELLVFERSLRVLVPLVLATGIAAALHDVLISSHPLFALRVDPTVGMAQLPLFVGKLVSWWVSLSSNTSGGTLAPMFLIGATMGEMLGIGFAHLFPGAEVVPGAFALVAMGVTFGVGARALLTGAVFALEVTGGYHLVVPMLVAMGVAELVAHRFLTERIMTDRLARRGVQVDFDTESDPLWVVTAGEVARRPGVPGRPAGAPVVPSSTPLRGLVPLLAGTGDRVVVVTGEGGHLVGAVTAHEVLEVLADRQRQDVIQAPTLHLRWPRLTQRRRRLHSVAPAPSEP